ncbi:MAG: DUF11 domain-containing protein [Sphingobacteriaceae bacterium]|nr:MAG: DUF11 domain-containing protein [Sphingobacteriaceae bacterium]
MNKLLHSKIFFPRYEKSIFIKVSLTIIALLVIATTPLYAQTYTWNNDVQDFSGTRASDYSGTVKFGDMSKYPTDKGNAVFDYKWYRTTKLTIGGKDNLNNYPFSSTVTDKNTDSYNYTLIVGPGYSKNWNFSVHKEGDACHAAVAESDCYSSSYTNNYDNSSSLSITTAAIKKPNQPEITSAGLREVTYISLHWYKGSNIPDNYLEYQIFRDGELAGTVTGNLRDYRDNAPPANIVHTYTVKTHLNADGRLLWGDQTSEASDGVQAFVYNNNFTASKTEYNKVVLKWDDLSKFADDIKVFRNGDELAVLNKSSRSYTDQDGVPGTHYLYGILPIKSGETFALRTDSGYKKSIGKISGTVRTKQGSAVPGVKITATTKIENKPYTYSATTDDAGYYELTELYFGSTDATFTLTPSYSDHKFNPRSLTRKLNLNGFTASGVDFTDTTALSISGKVYFPTTAEVSVQLPVEGAEIFIDGKSSGIKTKADGSYTITVFDTKSYKVQAKFNRHKLVTETSSVDSVGTATVNSAVTGFNFKDLQTDTLVLKVQAGCNAPIGEYANVVLSAKNNTGWKKTYQINAANNLTNGLPGEAIVSGIKKIVLPATDFKAEVNTVFGKAGPDANKLEYFQANYGALAVNLAKRDTTTLILQKQITKRIPAQTVVLPNGKTDVIRPARDTAYTIKDTSKVVNAHELAFIYHKDLKLNINDNAVFTSVNFASSNTKKYLTSQNDNPRLNIGLFEHYEYNGISYDCPLDSGTVYIYDAISDRDRQSFKLSTGGAITYTLKVGKPVIEAPFEKKLQVVAVVGGKSVSQEITVVVTGERARNSTFVTKTPQIPFFVLHDPPGDLSYAKISKGTTFSSSITNQYQSGGGAGAYVDAKVGAGTTAPFVGKLGTDVYVGASLEAGRDNTKSDATNMSFSFNEDFSTSGEETLVGNDGDLYVGASLNMQYALTDVLRYDAVKKDIVRDTSFAIDYTGFNSTYLYTEYHIKNTIIPQLKTLVGLSQTKFNTSLQQQKSGVKSVTDAILVQLDKERNENQASLNAWNTALTNNDNARKNPTVRTLPDVVKGIVGGNISFSAGAVYDNTLTTDTLTENSTEFAVYVNAAAKIGLGVHASDFNSLEAGAMMTVRMLNTHGSGSSTQNTKTVSYHLEDNDLGDFFSVGLFEDRKYGTPIFKTVTGSSSCPHEDNTQYRHLPSIAVKGTNEQRNVPADQPAKFQITIANRSESDETVEYAVKLDPLSNPNGAKVLVGGQDVVNGQATFTIPTGKAFDLQVEVTKGALSSTYENLALVMFSTCDNTLDDIDVNITSKPQVKLNAYFQSQCSTVDLFTPGNNWLVNQSNNNELYVAFSKYDASSGSPLTNVSLQYRKRNTSFLDNQWQTVVTIPKTQLNDKYYNYTFNVKNLDDGQYEIRAIAVCAGIDVTYSPVYSGVIDRKSAVAYGIPSPANGLLTLSDNISVTFNKSIACDDKLNPVTVALTRADNGQQIPVTYTCSGTGVQIKTVPESAINNLENVGLIASLQNVKDASGNLIKDTLSWRFVVKRSDVYWDPANIVMNATESRDTSFSTKLKNRTANDQTFSLTKFPAWLKPTVSSGKIPPLGELNIGFAVDSHLNTGQYTDTVTAVVNGKSQYLYVDVTVLRTPPVWRVNPAAYKYSMNVTTQFSRNETDTLISKDTRDKIAVFAGNECRGVGFIQFDDNLKKYVAFITAYSNTSGTEQLAFRLWDAYPGVEYQSVERLNFISNAIVGSTASPYIAHAGGVYQSIILKKGWNWISLNVKNTDMSVRTALASLKPTPGDEIKTLTSNAYSQYADKLGWVGKLDSISLYSGYMISVAHDDTLRVLGQVQRSPVRIQLNKGWSWIGYPMPINISLTNYLKNFNPADKDIVVSQEEFAQYNAATKSWSGSLQFLRPGKAYKVYSNNGISVPAFTSASQDNDATYISALINQPANTPVIYNNPQGAISSTIDPFLKVNSTDFKNNMTITAIISQDGGRVNDISRYEIRLSINNQLVSISSLTRLPNDQAVAFIPVYGNDNQEGQKVDVVIYDKQNQKQYPITISAIKGTLPTIQNQNGSGLGVLGPVTPSKDIYQQQDAILGTVEVPKIFALNGQADVSVTTALDKQQMSLGDTIHYTLKIKNSGPDAALNVVLADTLNTSFDYISSNTSGLVYSNATRSLSLNYTKLLSGEQHEIVVSLRANKVGQFNIGQSSVTLDNDPVSTNNRAPAIAVEVTDKRANEAKIFIPGLFTPNGDGINDRFVIVGLNDYYPSNTLIIYNKNYNEVYHKVNYQNDWSGNNLPMGSYAYFLKVTSATGIEKVFKGYITIAY